MPVTYEIDRGGGLIRTKCVGDVNLFEVLEHFRTLEKDPNRPDRLDVFLDLREMTSSPSAEEIRAASGGVAGIQGAVCFGICAVVAQRDALFGMSRMFGVFVEPFFRAIRVFRTATEAETWLQEQRSDYGNRIKHA
jgi:hypothetical protein